MSQYVNYSENELVTLLGQGDTIALSSLYYRHVKQLKYYVQRTARSPFLVEDIVHDTFIKIWEARGTIDPGQPFKPYLFTVAKRTLLTMLKRAQHESGIIAEMRKYATEGEQTTERTIAYNESDTLVTEAVNSLTGQSKEVFIRCRVQGLTYKQAAEELNITESTVNKHMNKALRDIRQYITLRHAVAVLLACAAIAK